MNKFAFVHNHNGRVCVMLIKIKTFLHILKGVALCPADYSRVLFIR